MTNLITETTSEEVVPLQAERIRLQRETEERLANQVPSWPLFSGGYAFFSPSVAPHLRAQYSIYGDLNFYPKDETSDTRESDDIDESDGPYLNTLRYAINESIRGDSNDPLIVLDVGAGTGLTWRKLAHEYRDHIKSGRLVFVVANLESQDLIKKSFVGKASTRLKEFFSRTHGLVRYIQGPGHELPNKEIIVKGKKVPLSGNCCVVHERNSISAYGYANDVDIPEMLSCLSERGIYFCDNPLDQDNSPVIEIENSELHSAVLSARKVGVRTATEDLDLEQVDHVEAGFAAGERVTNCLILRKRHPLAPRLYAQGNFEYDKKKRNEIPKVPKNIGIIAGHHANGEDIAYSTATRLIRFFKSRFSNQSGHRSENLGVFEHPSGRSYADAYRRAIQMEGNIAENYKAIIYDSQRVGYAESYAEANRNPDKLYFDIHDAQNGGDFGGNEGILLHLPRGMSEEQARRAIRLSFPAVQNSNLKAYMDFPIYFIKDEDVKDREGVGDFPPNYVVVELLTPRNLFDFPAAEANLRSDFAQRTAIKTLKEENRREADQEVLKFTRILERIVPAIEYSWRVNKKINAEKQN